MILTMEQGKDVLIALLHKFMIHTETPNTSLLRCDGFGSYTVANKSNSSALCQLFGTHTVRM